MFDFLNTAVRDPFGHISPTEVGALAPATRIIDVREPHEFYGELGHIARAELVPLGTIATQAASWSKEDDIVVVCRSGGRSARAAGLLAQLGFKHVRNMDGGMLAYVRTGLAVERSS
jgi:rhodanese-related sulfurtransferase